MKIAILSGKGGTGKTFVSVNLSCVLKEAVYVDCDVEEPNGHLFLHPEKTGTEPVTVNIPVFDPEKCIGCRKCVDFCRFHALAMIKNRPRLFTDVCHSCGGCALVCKEGAVREEKREVGILEMGKQGNVETVTGILHLGEASATPVIEKALSYAGRIEKPGRDTVIDCPPGSSCSVMTAIQPADVCVICAEETAFGFHNFQMVYKLAKLLEKPVGVVVNKYMEDYPPMEEFFRKENIRVLLRLPYKKEWSLRISKGETVVSHDGEARKMFLALHEKTGGLER